MIVFVVVIGLSDPSDNYILPLTLIVYSVNKLVIFIVVAVDTIESKSSTVSITVPTSVVNVVAYKSNDKETSDGYEVYV